MAMQPSKQRAMYYIIAAILSLAYFGSIAELCGKLSGKINSYGEKFTCPSRFNGALAMGILTALAAVASTILAFLDLSTFIPELCVTGFAIITNTAACALMTSTETSINLIELFVNLSYLSILAWVSEIFLIFALFNQMFAEDEEASLPTTSKAETTPLPTTYQHPQPAQYATAAPAPMPAPVPPPVPAPVTTPVVPPTPASS